MITSANYTTSRFQQYADMSHGFYSDYLSAQNEPSSLESAAKMNESAIAAIIFQALAIEAYINLMGTTIFGYHHFIKYYERKRTMDKLGDILAEGKISLSKTLISDISTLFTKRNRLVHAKPKNFEIKFDSKYYSEKEKNFEDINEIYEELSMPTSNIENEMKLFDRLTAEVNLFDNT